MVRVTPDGMETRARSSTDSDHESSHSLSYILRAISTLESLAENTSPESCDSRVPASYRPSLIACRSSAALRSRSL